jgi:hypothetical protein
MPCALCGSDEEIIKITMAIYLCKKDMERVKDNPLLWLGLKDKVDIAQIELAQEKV